MAKTELALIKNTDAYLPSAEVISETLDDLRDIMSRKLFGVISIAPAGAGTFKVLEPCADEVTNGISEIECVILASHPMNILWGKPFGERQKGERPICRSMNGDEGIDDGGEIHNCADCPNNQFGEDGQRKKCSNKRQLYVLRQGDVLPMLLTLPPSALSAYDRYRGRVRLSLKRSMFSVLTHIKLTNKTSDLSHAEYSVPVFEAIGLLPEAEAKRVEEFARGIAASAQRAGIVADELSNEAEDADAGSAAPAAGGFTVVPDEDIPDNF